MTDKLSKYSPLLPHEWDVSDARAMQQLAAGEATPDQQKRALAWIIGATGVNDLAFRPGGAEGDRDTAFACGKQHVGFGILKLLKADIAEMKQGEKKNV